ncbi:MAG: hypothetical protein IPG43_12785 [Proteobacteria bacterium]|nr:hypothetical protein [Pseudomonadota bacterium]
MPTVANPLVARQMEQLASALAARDNGNTSCRQRVAAMLRADLPRAIAPASRASSR